MKKYKNRNIRKHAKNYGWLLLQQTKDGTGLWYEIENFLDFFTYTTYKFIIFSHFVLCWLQTCNPTEMKKRKYKLFSSIFQQKPFLEHEKHNEKKCFDFPNDRRTTIKKIFINGNLFYRHKDQQSYTCQFSTKQTTQSFDNKFFHDYWKKNSCLFFSLIFWKFCADYHCHIAQTGDKLRISVKKRNKIILIKKNQTNT
jgi:hypothetical protein